MPYEELITRVSNDRILGYHAVCVPKQEKFKVWTLTMDGQVDTHNGIVNAKAGEVVIADERNEMIVMKIEEFTAKYELFENGVASDEIEEAAINEQEIDEGSSKDIPIPTDGEETQFKFKND